MKEFKDFMMDLNDYFDNLYSQLDSKYDNLMDSLATKDLSKAEYQITMQEYNLSYDREKKILNELYINIVQSMVETFKRNT